MHRIIYNFSGKIKTMDIQNINAVSSLRLLLTIATILAISITLWSCSAEDSLAITCSQIESNENLFLTNISKHDLHDVYIKRRGVLKDGTNFPPWYVVPWHDVKKGQERFFARWKAGEKLPGVFWIGDSQKQTISISSNEGYIELVLYETKDCEKVILEVDSYTNQTDQLFDNPNY